MKYNPKVNTALICIGEGAEASWYAQTVVNFLQSLNGIIPRVTKSLPGRSYRVANTGDIPNVLRNILATMVDR